jgi:predicted permease
VFENVRLDLDYAARSLAKRPVFALTAITTIALAIAANTAVFSVVNGMIFRPRPVRKSTELVGIYGRNSEQPQSHLPISYPDYLYIRDQANTLGSVAAYSPIAGALGRGESTEFVSGEIVSPNYFDTLGAPLHMGRAFARDDVGKPVVILSYRVWQRRFNSDRNVLGKQIEINSDRFTIIGVASEKFAGMIRGVSASFWITTESRATLSTDVRMWLEDRRARIFWPIGRIAAGSGRTAVDSNIRQLASRLREQHPEDPNDLGFTVIPLDRIAVHPDVDTAIRPAALAVTLLSALVLVIACANLAGLTLSVASARSKDIATRLAVGASRWRIVQPLLLESLAIAAAGGLCGLLLAVAAIHAFQSMPLPFPAPIAFDLTVDTTVLAFTITMTVVAGLLFGLMPALRVSTPNPARILIEETGFIAGGRGRSKARRVLVVAQVALSVMLLVFSGLTARSMGNAGRIKPGFDINGLNVGSLNVGVRNYSVDRGRLFYSNLLAKLETTPGVEFAAFTSHVPLSMSFELVRVTSEAGQSIAENDRPASDTATVSRNYFRTMNIPIVQGREFRERDSNTSEPVAVVNETLARQLWPDGSVIGRKIIVGPSRFVANVVGVARDGKYRTIGEAPLPFVYLNLEQNYQPFVTCIVRGRQSALRSAVRDIDPDVPLYGLQSMDERIGISMALPRYAAFLFGALGLLGNLLASVGLHGVVGYSVSERTREIGVRMALGSTPTANLWLVLKEGLTITVVGVALGLAVAVATANFFSGILYGVSPTDPLALVAASLLMVVTTIAACWIPAMRASRVDPTVALRHH